ncbi:MAG: nucleotide exchange factor GrpE [Pirellulales bacterium]
MSDDAAEPDIADESGLLGAADIVAAFTALRHELKLQVRAGRELTSGLDDLLDRCVGRHLAGLADRFAQLEAALRTASKPMPPAAVSGDPSRRLAEALTEIEDSLERATGAVAAQADDIDALATGVGHGAESDVDDTASFDLAEEWQACVGTAPWLVRTLAARLVGRLEQVFERALNRAGRAEDAAPAAALALADARQGLELLLVRTRRLMEQAGIRRLDVLHEPFDAERMRAIDVVEDAEVPEGHVAEQLRPGYLLHGAVLRPAEVRVAR